MILPATYWGTIGWWTAAQNEPFEVEMMESYPKQTFRNRCIIFSPSGEPITLSVPVRKVDHKQFTRDVEVSYEQHWQHQHWQAILSAYKKTPYFDYYQDYVRALYEREYRFLVDLNQATYDVTKALLDNRMPGASYPLMPTTDWSALDLESTWGNTRCILDELFKHGPMAVLK